MEVVAELYRGDRIVDEACRTRPDVAVLDIDLPGIDGLTAAGELYDRLPACRALVLTGLSQPGNLLRALKQHVRGFIVKDAPADALADGIRRVAAGERVIDPELIAAALETGSTPLTAGDRRAARRRQRPADRRDRRAAVAVPGDRAQLPVQRDHEAERPQPHRRDPDQP
jgi:two-component system response regulator DesR